MNNFYQKTPKLPLLILLITFGLGVANLVLFFLNRHTAIPRAWGFMGGDRNNLISWINICLQTIPLSFGVALLGNFILRKEPKHRIGWILTFLGFFAVLNYFLLEWTIHLFFTRTDHPVWYFWIAWGANFAWVLLMAFLLLIISLFPNGRFHTRSWRWVLSLGLLIMVSTLLLASMIEQPMSSAFLIPNPFIRTHPERLYTLLFWVGVAAMPIMALLSLTSTIFRFRRSKGRERQQMKWLLAGVTLVAFQIAVGSILAVSFGSIFGEVLVTHATLGLVVGIGVALVRHNLYDIDLIIRRTLIYALLSAVLAIIYFSSVLLIQSVITAVGGQQSAVVTVISTLIIAALFNPLRKSIQAIIDKRFYRSKYDAQQTLATFAATARDEVDLEKLTTTLLNVIQETMQPNHISLWLRRSENDS